MNLTRYTKDNVAHGKPKTEPPLPNDISLKSWCQSRQRQGRSRQSDRHHETRERIDDQSDAIWWHNNHSKPREGSNDHYNARGGSKSYFTARRQQGDGVTSSFEQGGVVKSSGRRGDFGVRRE